MSALEGHKIFRVIGSRMNRMDRGGPRQSHYGTAHPGASSGAKNIKKSGGLVFVKETRFVRSNMCLMMCHVFVCINVYICIYIYVL